MTLLTPLATIATSTMVALAVAPMPDIVQLGAIGVLTLVLVWIGKMVKSGVDKHLRLVDELTARLSEWKNSACPFDPRTKNESDST